MLNSHIEFYFTYQARRLCFDLIDLMDIDESRAKQEHTCRVALKPPKELQTATPLTLTISFESSLSYDRFIDLLVRSEVFYHHKPEVARPSPSLITGSWFGHLRRSHSGTSLHHHVDSNRNELKLMPARTQQLRNYLHLLNGWKDTNSV